MDVSGVLFCWWLVVLVGDTGYEIMATSLANCGTPIWHDGVGQRLSFQCRWNPPAGEFAR